MAAATRRFGAHGFAGTTTAEVAADADVAEGTVYLHFGTKAGLLIAVMNDYYDGLVAEVEAVAQRPGTAKQRLRRLVDCWLLTSERDWSLTSVFRELGRFRGDESIATAFVENNRRITGIVDGVIDDLKQAGAVRQELATALLRDAIFGTIEHVQLSRLESLRRRSVDRVGQDLLDLLMQGAADRGGERSPHDAAEALSLLDVEAGSSALQPRIRP